MPPTKLRPQNYDPAGKVLDYKIPNSTRLQKDLESLGIAYRTEIGDLDFHALRHTSATNFTANGANSAQVQQLLGHKTRAMAEHYTIKSGIDVSAELSKQEPVFIPEAWTDIGTDFPDFWGHRESQADPKETVSESTRTPVTVPPRRKKAPQVTEGREKKNGGGSRIRTSERLPEQIYSLRALATCISHHEGKPKRLPPASCLCQAFFRQNRTLCP